MISIIKGKIENVTVELTVEETVGSQLGGYPVLHFGEVLIQSKMVAEVDTLAVIKAIATSETVDDFSKATMDCYFHDEMVIMLKSFALQYCTDDYVSDCQFNIQILDEIAGLEKFLRDKEISPKSKMMVESRIYDLRSQLVTFDPWDGDDEEDGDE